MSLRWTSYVVSKPPEGGSKTQNGRFPCKIALCLKKICYKVYLCENHQWQSCKAFIGLTICAAIGVKVSWIPPDLTSGTSCLGSGTLTPRSGTLFFRSSTKNWEPVAECEWWWMMWYCVYCTFGRVSFIAEITRQKVSATSCLYLPFCSFFCLWILV